jgi:hypothetical protein
LHCFHWNLGYGKHHFWSTLGPKCWTIVTLNSVGIPFGANRAQNVIIKTLPMVGTRFKVNQPIICY